MHKTIETVGSSLCKNSVFKALISLYTGCSIEDYMYLLIVKTHKISSDICDKEVIYCE